MELASLMKTYIGVLESYEDIVRYREQWNNIYKNSTNIRFHMTHANKRMNWKFVSPKVFRFSIVFIV